MALYKYVVSFPFVEKAVFFLKRILQFIVRATCLQQAVKDNYSIVVEKNLLNNGINTRFEKNNKHRTKEKVRLQTYKRLCERVKNLNKLRVIDKE